MRKEKNELQKGKSKLFLRVRRMVILELDESQDGLRAHCITDNKGRY